MIPCIKDQRIFITGGAGFIGSALVERLVADNEIAVCDSFRRNALSSRPVAHHPHLSIITGDVLDYEQLHKAIGGFDPTIVIHCAVISGTDTVVKKPTGTLRVNLLGTAHLLEAERQLQRVDRIVCFSTSAVFGRTAFHVNEVCDAQIGAVGEVRWTYAVSKLAGEHLARLS